MHFNSVEVVFDDSIICDKRRKRTWRGDHEFRIQPILERLTYKINELLKCMRAANRTDVGEIFFSDCTFLSYTFNFIVKKQRDVNNIAVMTYVVLEVDLETIP